MSVHVVNPEYLTDEEYEAYWFGLGRMREKISGELGLTPQAVILDVGTGWGLFAVEMAKQLGGGLIVGIDITRVDTGMAKKLVREAKVDNIVQILRVDATNLSFQSGCFHQAVSFLGMRDIYMTRSEKGVREAVKEMIRVTKPGGRIAVCVTPPEDMETEDQRLAVEVEGEVFGARSLPRKFYVDIFNDNKITLSETRMYYTNKKLTENQAAIELKEGIRIAREVYRRNVPDFEVVWKTYGDRIRAFGYGMYSKVVMLLGEKAT